MQSHQVVEKNAVHDARACAKVEVHLGRVDGQTAVNRFQQREMSTGKAATALPHGEEQQWSGGVKNKGLEQHT